MPFKKDLPSQQSTSENDSGTEHGIWKPLGILVVREVVDDGCLRIVKGVPIES